MFIKRSSRIIQIDKDHPDKKIVDEAAYVLRRGGFVIYPTDTAYGIGVNANDEQAIEKLYKIKGREFQKPTHVVMRDWNMIEEYTITNRAAQILYDKYIPGPLTLILPKKENVLDTLTAELPTVGIRIPNFRLTTLLSNAFEYPYTTPSANRTKEKTPYSVDEIKDVLDISKVDLILDAGELDKDIKPSTIVDISRNPIKILREGPISGNEIVHTLKVSRI